MNQAHFYYLLNVAAWPPIQWKASISCCKVKVSKLMPCTFCTHGGNWIQISCMQRQRVCAWITSLPFNIWLFDLFHSISPEIFCLAMSPWCHLPHGPAGGPSGPFVLVGFRWEREPKLIKLYLPPQLVSEQQESRPLLSPSIDDFLCETKCDGLSRPVTSNTAGTVQPRFPNSLSNQGHFRQRSFEASWA